MKTAVDPVTFIQISANSSKYWKTYNITFRQDLSAAMKGRSIYNAFHVSFPKPFVEDTSTSDPAQEPADQFKDVTKNTKLKLSYPTENDKEKPNSLSNKRDTQITKTHGSPLKT